MFADVSASFHKKWRKMGLWWWIGETSAICPKFVFVRTDFRLFVAEKCVYKGVSPTLSESMSDNHAWLPTRAVFSQKTDWVSEMCCVKVVMCRILSVFFGNFHPALPDAKAIRLPTFPSVTSPLKGLKKISTAFYGLIQPIGKLNQSLPPYSVVLPDNKRKIILAQKF